MKKSLALILCITLLLGINTVSLAYGSTNVVFDSKDGLYQNDDYLFDDGSEELAKSIEQYDRYDFEQQDLYSGLLNFAVGTMYNAQQAGVLTPYYVTITRYYSYSF